MLRSSLIVLVAAAVTLGLAQPALADDTETVTASETAQALASVPGVLASSDAVHTSSDADSAATSTVNGTTVDTPRDASDGVTLQSSGAPAVKIELPNADNAANGTVVAPGTVAYPSSNGSANAVQATEDGGLRMLTVIDSADAPTSYTYNITIPNGGVVELGGNGSAFVTDAAGQTIFEVPAPWANDAKHNPVPTHFEVAPDGRHLTQVVEHQGANVAYPVTADPWVHRWYGWDLEFNRNQTNNIMFGLASATAASLFIPDPTITKIVAAALGVLTGYANWAYNRGGCLKLRVTYLGGWIAGHYFGGNCR